MGKRSRKWGGLALVGGLVLVLLLPLIPAPVWADDVTVYLTEDSYMDEGTPDSNYGSSTSLWLQDYDSSPSRAILKIPDQSGGGNITEVLLKMYYFDYWEVDPEGKKIRVYRCLEDMVESEVTWNDWKNGWEWTNPGGDYTSANYAEAEMPEEDNWVTWNITEMAEDAWITDGEDLYVIIRFKYETKNYGPPITLSIIVFYSAEAGGTTYDPRIVVSYEEEVQTPEVDATMNEYGSEYVKLNVFPTLYDWPSANVSIQIAPSGGAWTWESAITEIDSDETVVCNYTSLNQSTAYVGRGKLVYASGTVYSGNVSFTTKDYDVPVWDIDADDITPNTATLSVSWTGNNDEKEVGARVQYRRSDIGDWTTSSLELSSEITDEFSWNVTDLQSDRTYYYRGRFAIDGYLYYTDAEEFSTTEGPDLDAWVNDADFYFFQLGCNYTCNEVDEISLQARYRPDGSSTWTYSTNRAGLSGNGTEYFLFEGLSPAVEHDWYITATYDGGTSSTFGSVWTADIDEYPEMTGLDATFVSPNIIRVTVEGELNDVSVSILDPEFYVKFRPTWELTWQTSTDVYDITADGTWTVDLIAGDELLWDSTYDYYGVVAYTVGTNETDQDIFAVPSEPFAVSTVEIVGLSGTTGRMVGNLQLADLDSADCKFLYWVQGSGQQHSTTELSRTSSGQYTIDVTGLVYGEYYSFKAYATDPDGVLPAVEGATLNFRAGYWSETVPPEGGDDVFDVYGRIWNWFANSTAGHWTILLLGMGVLALIFHRQKAIAVVCCLLVLGIGIIIGWVDTWVIVLLALGAGLTIWRFIGSHKGSTI